MTVSNIPERILKMYQFYEKVSGENVVDKLKFPIVYCNPVKRSFSNFLHVKETRDFVVSAEQAIWANLQDYGFEENFDHLVSNMTSVLNSAYQSNNFKFETQAESQKNPKILNFEELVNKINSGYSDLNSHMYLNYIKF